MNKTLLGAIVFVVVIIGIVLFTNNNATAPVSNNDNNTGTQTQPPNETSTPVDNETPTDPSPVATDPEPQTYTVSMTDTAYAPSTLTVKKGDTVKFVNNGTKPTWPASAPHPTHTDYPAFDPKKAVAVGESWSFTFDKVGTWRYHDHLNPTHFGSVTVQ
jgi:plastocyanin